MPLKSNCANCGTICFSRNKEEKLCKPCSSNKRRKHPDKKLYQREWGLLKKYNLDNLDFETIWIAFKGKCGICSQDLIMPKYQLGQPSNAAVIDHNHLTNNLRGLLCNNCNRGIGFLKDSKEILLKAYNWIN